MLRLYWRSSFGANTQTDRAKCAIAENRKESNLDIVDIVRAYVFTLFIFG